MKKIYVIIILFFLEIKASAFQAVDMNSASFEQIALLPGVGKMLAQNIVAYRDKNGPYANKESLRSIQGMTEKKLLGIKDQIVFLGLPKKNKKIENPKPLPELVLLPSKPLISLHELEAKALQANGLSQDFDQSLSHRVRKAAFLPKLTAEFDVDQSKTIAEKGLDYTKDSRLTRGGRGIGAGVRIAFDLDKLIFNKDELDVATLSLKRLEKREELIARLHKYYFRYARLLETIKTPMEATASQSVSMELREVEAELDYMSRGEFTRFQSLGLK